MLQRAAAGRHLRAARLFGAVGYSDKHIRSMRLLRQRDAIPWLLLAALLAASAAARPMPQLAEPNYTLYHTMCVGGDLHLYFCSCRSCRRRRCFARLPPAALPTRLSYSIA